MVSTSFQNVSGNSTSGEVCRIPAAGEFCESDFYTEYSFFAIPHITIITTLEVFTAMAFLLISRNDVLLIKTARKGLSWSILRKRYKLRASINFCLVSCIGPSLLITFGSRCKYCLSIFKINFFLAALLSHEGMFFLALFFFQVQGMLSEDLRNLVKYMRMGSTVVLAMSPLTGFVADLDTISFMRVHLALSSVAFLLNFTLIELYRNTILDNVELIKERAKLASGEQEKELPATNPAMILAEKVNAFLAGSRQHLPPNVLIGIMFGLSPILEKFYYAPYILLTVFGSGITFGFIAIAFLMAKSRKNVIPVKSFWTNNSSIVLPFASILGSKVKKVRPG